jgi:hypothetical protein
MCRIGIQLFAIFLLLTATALLTGLATGALAEKSCARSCCESGETAPEPMTPCTAFDCQNCSGISVTMTEPVGLSFFLHESALLEFQIVHPPPELVLAALFRPPKSV